MQAVILLKIQIKGLFFPGQYLPVNTTGTSKTLKPWVFRVIKILSTNGLKLFLSCLVPFPALSYSFSLPQWNPAQPNQAQPTLPPHPTLPSCHHAPYLPFTLPHPTFHTMDMLWEKFQWILPFYMKPNSFQPKASVVCSVTTFIDFCLNKLNVFSQHIGQNPNEYLNSWDKAQGIAMLI